MVRKSEDCCCGDCFQPQRGADSIALGNEFVEFRALKGRDKSVAPLQGFQEFSIDETRAAPWAIESRPVGAQNKASLLQTCIQATPRRQKVAAPQTTIQQARESVASIYRRANVLVRSLLRLARSPNRAVDQVRIVVGDPRRSSLSSGLEGDSSSQDD